MMSAEAILRSLETSSAIGAETDAILTERTARNREFSVAAPQLEQIAKVKEFLAGMATDLGEECIYFRAGGRPR
ncbi:MAG: hypothetical protein JO307_10845 [Bryobacterales bacterium]|nr:hypothetical protein [Bryobacterales bacterium]